METADILERARLRREALLKTIKEEGINNVNFSESRFVEPTQVVPTNVKPAKSSLRRSNSFSDLSQKSVKDRLLSWKVMEQQQQERTNKIVVRSQLCGSLTSINIATHKTETSAPPAQPLHGMQIIHDEQEISKTKKLFSNYSSYNASNDIENKENTSTNKHYLQPKFGPLTMKKLASVESNANSSTGGIKKLGPVTQVIQEKLSKLCQESWKRNQIAEDIQRKKDEDLKLLTGRWKNGLVSDADNGDNEKLSTNNFKCIHNKEGILKDVITDMNGIPLPPPLPPNGEIPSKSWKSSITSDDKIKKNNQAPKDFTISKVMPAEVKNAIPGTSRVNSKTSIKPFIASPADVNSTSQVKKISSRDSNLKKICNPSASNDRHHNLITKCNGTIGNASKSRLNMMNFNSAPKPFLKDQIEKKFAPVGMRVAFAVANNDSITSADSFTENFTNDFKKNLKAMGYQKSNDGNEVMIELESAPEEENYPKDAVHDLKIRTRLATNKSRVQSHIEGPSHKNNKISTPKVKESSRPISMIEHKNVMTNFSNHDVVTVTKRKFINIDVHLENSNNGRSPIKNENRTKNSNIKETQQNINSLPRIHCQPPSVDNKSQGLNGMHIDDQDDKEDEDDTYGLDDDHQSVNTCSDSMSSGSLKVEELNNRMETYFSITDVQSKCIQHDNSIEKDNIYVQMSGTQRRISSDNVSDDCYSATEEESAVYEEIGDASLTPKSTRQASKRHVSMRRAFNSNYSDEDLSETDDNNEHAVLLRNKTQDRPQKLTRPFTTTNACFDPPGHSSPIRNFHKSSYFGGSVDRNMSSPKDKMCNKRGHSSGHRKKDSKFKSKQIVAPPGTLARLAASSHHERQNEIQSKHHIEQFLERRGLLSQPPSSCGAKEHQISVSHSPQRKSNPTVPAKSSRIKVQGLEELIEQEEKFSSQASNALSICMKKSNLWTSEAVECHRILLISAKKKEILLSELKRAREGDVDTGINSPKDFPVVGKLTISGVRLPLKPEFIAKLGSQHDTSVTYFIVIIQSGESISSSQTVSTKDPIILSGLEIPGQLILAGVPTKFKAFLEVYALTVPRHMKCSASKKVFAVKKATEIASKRFSYKTDSEDEQSVSAGFRTSYFQPVGRLELNDKQLAKGHFLLGGVNYSSPLQGSMHLKMKHFPEAAIHHRGYLSICPEGSREFMRKWCCLTQSEINMWKNASDELVKEPALQIDLMSCISEMLVPIPIDYRSQKDTFEMAIVKQSNASGRMKERMSEKNVMPSNLQISRYWFSADSAEECNTWCRLINKNLLEVRTWHPYAIPPVKFKTPQTSPFTFDSLL